jgi:hypothetical protein
MTMHRHRMRAIDIDESKTTSLKRAEIAPALQGRAF